MFWEFIGGIAASLTMFSFFPQIFKILRTKSAKDVSPVMLLQLATGVFLWILYGLHLKNLIIILANAITLCSLIVLLILYYLYGKK